MLPQGINVAGDPSAALAAFERVFSAAREVVRDGGGGGGPEHASALPRAVRAAAAAVVAGPAGGGGGAGGQGGMHNRMGGGAGGGGGTVVGERDTPRVRYEAFHSEADEAQGIARHLVVRVRAYVCVCVWGGGQHTGATVRERWTRT